MPPPPPLSPQALSALIAIDTSLTGLGYFTVSNIALFYFEYFITLGDEIEHVWRRKRSPVSIIYLLNRYLGFFGYIIFSLGLFDPAFGTNGPICKRYAKYEGSLSITLTTFSCILMTFRAYAIYGQSKLVLAGLVVIMVAQVGWAAFSFIGESLAVQPPPFSACVLSGTTDLPGLNLFPLIFDSTVLALTLGRTIKVSRSIPTMRVLLRDGIMYFVVIFSSTAAWTFMKYLAAPVYHESLAAFCPLITVIMVNRLTINLRTSSNQTVPWPVTSGSGVSSFRQKTPQFQGQTNDSEISSFPMHPLHPEIT